MGEKSPLARISQIFFMTNTDDPGTTKDTGTSPLPNKTQLALLPSKGRELSPLQRLRNQDQHLNHQSDLQDPIECIKQRSQLCHAQEPERSISPLLAHEDSNVEQNSSTVGLGRKYVVKGVKSNTSCSQLEQSTNDEFQRTISRINDDEEMEEIESTEKLTSKKRPRDPGDVI